MEIYDRAIQAADDNVLRHTRIACWIPKAADTHSIYNTDFLLEQLWNARASMLRYAYIAHTVCSNEMRRADRDAVWNITNIQCGLTSFADDHGFAAEDTTSFPLWVCTLRFGYFMRFITVPLNVSSNPCM
jgi:hypothetical protein